MGKDTQKPSYPQILELPAALTPAQFQALVSDRIRELNLLLKGVAYNPAVVDLAMANFRITGLADPTDDLDAVNLRTLRRQGGGSTQVASVASSGGDGAYTIVYNIPGFLGPDETITAFVVGRDRTGRPAEAWVYALGEPTVTAASFQLTQNDVDILTTPLILPLNSNGPIFLSSIVGGVSFKHGDVIKLFQLEGSASGISVGLVVERD